MIPLIIVRPEPGATATLEAARALGLDAAAFPIFVVRPVSWIPVPRDSVDAVILGSANALRHGGGALDSLRDMPAYCVGLTTAVAASEAGLRVVGTGSGGLQNVLGMLEPGHRRLLRLTGVSRVPLTLPPGVTMETRVVYSSDAEPISDGLARALQVPAVVMLHSGDAASHFEKICREAGIDRSRIALAVIGPRATHGLSEGWAEVKTAAQPSDTALLALAGEMCKD